MGARVEALLIVVAGTVDGGRAREKAVKGNGSSSGGGSGGDDIAVAVEGMVAIAQ